MRWVFMPNLDRWGKGPVSAGWQKAEAEGGVQERMIPLRFLRRHQDAVSLVAAWALLLQAFVGPMLPSLHAAAGFNAALCSTKTIDATKPASPIRHRTTCDCCSFACRLGCGLTAGLLPYTLRVPLPSSAPGLLNRRAIEAPVLRSIEVLAAQPRGPPLA